MAGAFAFVFGLCALSFAGGCVVTAIMLRRTNPAEEVATTAPEVAEPEQLAAREERPDLTWPPDDFTAKPIHRNPVVGLPAPAALDPVPADTAPAVLALAPDPTFAGMVETPPAPWLTLAAEPPVLVAVEPLAEDEEDVPEGVAEAEAAVEPEPETMFVSRSGLVTGAAATTDLEPEAGHRPHLVADPAPEAEAPVVEPVRTLEVDLAVVASIVPDSGPESEVPADPFGEVVREPAEPEPRTGVGVSAVEAHPTGEVDQVLAESADPEPRAEADPSTTAAPVAEAAPVEPEDQEPRPAVEAPTSEVATPVTPEPRPAQVLEIAPEAPAEPAAPKPEPVRDALVSGPDAVVPVGEPETVVLPVRAVSVEPTTVVPKQQLQLSDSEFRQRYLRTFEAARRRSNH